MASKRFKRQTEAQCLAAIGLKDTSDKTAASAQYEVLHLDAYPNRRISDSFRKALIPDDSLIKKIPKPGRDDWLACHPESGQTFARFTQSLRNIPDKRRNTIYILPVNFFENDVPVDVTGDLADFASLFFGTSVKLLKLKTDLKKKVPNRVNDYTGNIQVDAGVVINEMKRLVPQDAFCVGALTLCDLYPRDEWNFVFGLASLHGRVGVYSLARLLPGFPESQPNTADLTSDQNRDLLLSACRLMCHEMCHMFGLKHCIFYHCLMNGSNNYEESMAKPLHLCPVCLRKLQLSCGFEVLQRYQELRDWCRQKGLEAQEQWLTRRIQTL